MLSLTHANNDAMHIMQYKFSKIPQNIYAVKHFFLPW